ncbi:MAG TPA: galactose-1-phosphate uridylyltransferase [Streptosporangiaceae bacterium]|nr:galactose-1-phosphate uridylyltransferase [Streptosporangiaceae bacterium]
MRAGHGQLAWKNSGRLADGREIIYFDETPGLDRAAAPDTREGLPHLPAVVTVSPESAVRWDPLLGEWVVIAAQRQDRTFLPPPDQCPLDPSAPGKPTEIPADSYDVVVFENRFPSLRGAPAATGTETANLVPDGMSPLDGTPLSAISPQIPAYGRCEVVCFTSDHNASFASLPPRRVRTVIEAWADRTASLSAMDGIEQVYCFENRGEEIGVTLHHPHGQIYAFPFVTPRTRQMVARSQAHAARTGRNLFDDLVAEEKASGVRLVASNDEWIAVVPPAARWPYEVVIFPARRVPDLAALDEDARDAFGHLYLDVLRRFDGLFGTPAPYIAAWHQAPVTDQAARRDFGMHLQVLSVRRAPGKLKYLAGTESGMGVWINDIAPETAARRLREAG